jgi:hypothetical protein
MSSPRPAARPRISGGFNQNMGAFNEHLDDDAMQNAMQQKGLTQQNASAADPTGMGGGGALPGAAGTQNRPAQPPKPREIGSITEELVNRPAQDIFKGLKSIFDLNSLLGLPQAEDDPQTKARKQQMLQRYNKLSDEQQAVARQKYQESMQKKQAEEQEKQAKKQQEEQQKSQTINVPSGTKKGPEGPGGSKKQKAVNKLQQDRKTLGGPKGSN